jgi:chromosome segregation ATPase
MGTRLKFISLRQSAFFLLTSLLLGGCHDTEPNPSSATQKDTTQKATQKPTSSGTALPAETESVLSSAEQSRRTEQRVAELEQELTDSRAQQTHLVQKREEISARIAAQQEDGMQLLNSLKAQHRTSSGLDPSFEAAARSQLETALAQDRELNHELQAAEKELSDVDTRVATLTADLDAIRNIRTAQRQTEKSGSDAR